MAHKLTNGFVITSTDHIDARLSVSYEDMTNRDFDARMPDSCIVICKETGEPWTYARTNEFVKTATDLAVGRFRPFNATTKWGTVSGNITDQRDLSDALNKKVDKEAGKSLVSNENIEKLESLNKVEKSIINGNIRIEDQEVTVYKEPEHLVIDPNYVHTDNNLTDELVDTWNNKQDKINDLSTIRSGALKGATALQRVPEEYKTKEENDLLYQAKGDVPTKISELENDSNFIEDELYRHITVNSSSVTDGVNILDVSQLSKDAYEHINNKDNPHEVKKSDLGLSKVENKSSADIRKEITADNIPGLDASKIVSGKIPNDRIASADAWDAKQTKLFINEPTTDNSPMMSSITIDGKTYKIIGTGGEGKVKDVQLIKALDSEPVSILDETGIATIDFTDHENVIYYEDTEDPDAIIPVTDVLLDGKNVVSGSVAYLPKYPSKTSDLENNSNFITNSVNNLINYYLKSEVYTKEEVQLLIGRISSLELIKVDKLPTENIKTSAIYLVPNEQSEENNIYTEYLYMDGKWEIIGTTTVDLSQYALKTEIPTKLSQLINDASYSQFSGSYNDLSDKPTIVSDVKANGESVVVDGVANIPIGTTTKVGVYLANSIDELSNTNRGSSRVITGNTLDYAVKVAMCDGKGAAWTNEEKIAARDRLGISDAITEALAAIGVAEERSY